MSNHINNRDDNTPPKGDRDEGVQWNTIELESYNMMAARAIDALDLPTIERCVPVKELYALVEWAHKQDRRVVNRMKFPGEDERRGDRK